MMSLIAVQDPISATSQPIGFALLWQVFDLVTKVVSMAS